MSKEEEQIVTHQEFQVLVRDMNDIKGLMGKMVEALSRISVLDERTVTVNGFMQKLDERMGRMEARQHDADIARAVAQTSASRVDVLSKGFQEMHVERERDKARFQTIVWMVRGLWAVAAMGGVTYLSNLISIVKVAQ